MPFEAGLETCDAGSAPRSWVLLLIFAIATLVIFSPLLNSSFQEDDFAFLRAASKGDIFGFAGHDGSYFQPLVSFSFWLQSRLFGLNPLPYRIFNDLFHAGNATLCALLAGELRPGKKLLPWIAGILFLVLPSHGEAISWICARGDLISAFFGLLATLAFLKYLQKEEKRLIVGTCAALLVGLTANQSIVWLPVALAASLNWFEVQEKKTPFLALSATLAVYAFGRLLLAHNLIDGMRDRVFGPKLIEVTLVQICRSVLPSLPSADVRLTNITFLKTAPGVAVMVSGLFIFGWGFWRARGSMESKNFKLLAGLSLASFLAVIGLFVHLPFPYTERFVYFPSAVTCIAVAIGIVSIARPYRIALAASAIGAAALLLFIENRNWILAADLSNRLALSFSRDVLPQVQTQVYLASEPATVNGAEALGNQFPAVAELYDHRDIEVKVGAEEDVLSDGNRTELKVREGRFFIHSMDPNAVYDAGATGIVDQAPTPEDLNKSGLFKFSVPEVGVLPHAEPTFYWDGAKFQRITWSRN